MKVILKYLNEIYNNQKRYGFKDIEKDRSEDTDRSVRFFINHNKNVNLLLSIFTQMFNH